ncbi:TPA: fimbrial protein [Escherichia coli]|nr:fimbrial protein [Escherichia coli]HEL7977797.1 fimbrial protein [Escherichia coli]HEL7987497.1 fimbrial protein [Escherichia coli]HEL8020277.1 fimbrial protein [Escherichia coli]HEL8067674.1 fimbrial protein [Escherichia coli]
MKKTLIALAVATTAFSGAAMADWVQGGSGGSVDISGILTPSTSDSPWEVMVGDAVPGLDANVETGQTIVTIPVSTVIPVLGIRNTDVRTFAGQSGMTPQIDFNNALDTSAFSAGKTTLTLDVKNASQEVIGSLSTDLTAVAERSYFNASNGNGGARGLFASAAGYAFYGGVGVSDSGVLDTASGYALAPDLISDILDNYERSSNVVASAGEAVFSNTSLTYSGYYVSGIQAGETITITLNEGAAGDSINWTASLPVTVTYL